MVLVMPDSPDVFPPFKSSPEPLNGERVTLARLYEELYNLDQGLGKRFTTFLEIMVGLREDFEEHRKDGHPKIQREETVREKLKLEAKQVALLGGFVTFLATVAGVIGAVIGS